MKKFFIHIFTSTNLFTLSFWSSCKIIFVNICLAPSFLFLDATYRWFKIKLQVTEKEIQLLVSIWLEQSRCGSFVYLYSNYLLANRNLLWNTFHPCSQCICHYAGMLHFKTVSISFRSSIYWSQGADDQKSGEWLAKLFLCHVSFVHNDIF